MSVITLPKAFKPLLDQEKRYRYYCFKGGRGGAKSETIARALLILGTQESCNILCAREFQNSIRESVHGLLESIIHSDPALSQFYTVLTSEIRGKNGTQFIFSGLRNKILSVKSIHNIKYCWVEEAETVSAYSWKILIPSIRGEGSEIWVSYNPELEDSATNQLFVYNTPNSALVRHVNYDENPYFPDVLRLEMEDLKARNYEEYLHVWEGHCKQAVEGAVFAEQLEQAKRENRIGRFPYDANYKVHTSWDLGRSDFTSIWFIQQIGTSYQVIDFYQNNGYGFDHYAEIVKSKSYIYGTHWLPHDAKHHHQSAVSSIHVQAQRLLGDVQIAPNLGNNKKDGINAAQTAFSRVHFNSETTSDGLSSLRRWHYRVNEENGVRSSIPVHDEFSHGADAFCEFFLANSMPKLKKKVKMKPQAQGWQAKLNAMR